MILSRGLSLVLVPVMLALLLLAPWAGCSASAEYTCPDPVGQIIRDDCEVYRTRYESLKVELGASLGPLGASAALGAQKLRDVSELLQVFGHRMHALCKDFNACRVAPVEYRQRREAADRTFTSIVAIQGQLQQAGLDAQTRAKLAQALIDALRGDASPPSQMTRATKAAPRRGGHYTSWIPWYGAKHLPPRPPARAGFPQLTWVDVDMAVGLRQTGPNSYTNDGYAPQVTVALRGTVQPDDTITMIWGGGQRTEEPVSRGKRNGLAVHNARAPQKEVRLKGSSFTVEVVYRRGDDGKSATIGRRTFPVVSRAERSSRWKGGVYTYWGVDHDPFARQGQLVFRPGGGVLPPAYDQPSLRVVLKLRKYHRPTARCWVDGKRVGTAMEPSRYSGQEETFQDKPRYRDVSPGRSVGVSHPHVEWWRYDFPLPCYVPRASGGGAPEGLARWPRPGKWRCVVSLEGEPVRELTFTVRPDGGLEPHPRQLDFPRAAWLVRTRVIPSPVEQPLGRFAHTGQPAGGPGPQGPPAAAPAPPRPALRVALRLAKTKGTLSPGQLRRVMTPLRDGLRACLEESGASGTVAFKAHVYPGGRAGSNMDSQRYDGWLRYCISKVMRSARFPAVEGYTYFDVTLQATGGGAPAARRGPMAAWAVKGGLSAARVLEGLGPALPKLRACARRNPDRYRIKLSVGTDGRVEAQDWARGYHPAVVGCMRSELKALRLPRAEPYTTLILELRLGR